jgi:hypothetical protein
LIEIYRVEKALNLFSFQCAFQLDPESVGRTKSVPSPPAAKRIVAVKTASKLSRNADVFFIACIHLLQLSLEISSAPVKIRQKDVVLAVTAALATRLDVMELAANAVFFESLLPEKDSSSYLGSLGLHLSRLRR